MLISHRFKFIVINIPKTASNSYRDKLNKYTDVWGERLHQTIEEPKRFYQHDSLPKIKERFVLNNWDIDQYFKYVTIRNPWQRYASYYMWAKKHEDSQYLYLDNKHLSTLFNKYNSKQEKILEQIIVYNLSQDNFLLIDNKECVDYIARLETIDEDFNKLCEILNIPKTKLLHRNKSERYDYRELYTQKLIDLVYEKEKYVIEKYKYSFE